MKYSYDWEYHDKQLGRMVFRCKAQDGKEADEKFKQETGVYPSALKNIRRRLI
jgi:hypothetical protein